MHISFIWWLLLIYLLSIIPCWMMISKRIVWLAFYPVLNTAAVIGFLIFYLNGRIKSWRENRNWNKRRWKAFSKKPNFPLKGQKL